MFVANGMVVFHDVLQATFDVPLPVLCSFWRLFFGFIWYKIPNLPVWYRLVFTFCFFSDQLALFWVRVYLFSYLYSELNMLLLCSLISVGAREPGSNAIFFVFVSAWCNFF